VSNRGRRSRRCDVPTARLRRVVWRSIQTGVGLVVISVLLVIPLRWVAPPTTAFMVQEKWARAGHISERGLPARVWNDWRELSPELALAVIASEDQRFLRHYGFDFEAIVDALEEHQDGSQLRGASTISQQLAKNLYLWPERNLLRKALEGYFTLLLELFLTKRRILEIYLNVVEFGPGVYGAATAADHFFDQSSSDIDARQAALLAAVLPNPKRFDVGDPSPYVRNRQNWILSQMEQLRRSDYVRGLQGAWKDLHSM